MPTSLGAHNARVDFARDLLTKKGRSRHGRFSFEGATLLADAAAARVPIEAIYATQHAYGAVPLVRELEETGAQVHIVEERTMSRISAVETPSGVLAVAPILFHGIADVLAEPGVVLALAGINDPGNAGTLLRSAEAFGVTRVIFGAGGVDPHLPKVVRAAMGALFRLRIATATPAQLAAATGGWQVTGLAARGEPLERVAWAKRALILVGSERRGLTGWDGLCERMACIPMGGSAESLNAGVAGSIALYEASKRRDI